MQSTLTSLYVSSTNRQLYDHVIPALFASGQSKLARTWRKKLVVFKDLPLTSKSRPFLLFLANYYPHIQLTVGELAVAELDRQSLAAETDDDESFLEVDRKGIHRRGTHSDALVAKWFASTWTSVEFAVNFIYKLGVRTIGPRSLQSLALRDPDAKEVASRIDQVERLGIRISPQSYCKILVSFARTGEDDLLIDLLHCDIHPDEFEDMETRHSLMAEAARTGNWKMERLLQGIEWAIETGPTSRRLNSLLRSELSKRSLGKAREVLDRMEALKINMAQASATGLLKRVFWKLDSHPQRSQRSVPKDIGLSDSDDPFLDRALNVIRRISCHEVAIPIRYWKMLLYKLGRSRRLEELEQLSLEIMQFYTPPYGGLVPVHREDLPKHFSTEEKEYIPADLPFVHHHHPIRLIFDSSLQRSIVRWGFDQTLATKPQPPASLTPLQTASFSQFDVARGVRLLAALRDQGALIDTQVVRSSVISRIATGMVPGRPRHRARDSVEFSIESLMDLVEEAWGSEMFPDTPRVIQEVEARKSKLWNRYPRLIDKTFDKDFT
ncbi:pentatricopeptide repeat domain-containing [Trichoderma arundinaceum]|uniref:Pentatricopeptide repeat domain-containing n=1 Tax=Trichoderma arundinaceum TaxID=490622 RepID=A0A395NE68_TRIAR|nr:pentatricopeptide repeat domain-containing [Trichoderma arundinaceum]